jgi:hypothetical protein
MTSLPSHLDGEHDSSRSDTSTPLASMLMRTTGTSDLDAQPPVSYTLHPVSTDPRSNHIVLPVPKPPTTYPSLAKPEAIYFASGVDPLPEFASADISFARKSIPLLYFNLQFVRSSMADTIIHHSGKCTSRVFRLIEFDF